MDLWNKGHLDILAARAKAHIRPPSGRSKTQREARRAAQLLRKNQIARSAALSGSLGIAEATTDTINAIGPLFPDPGPVDPQDLRDFYGPVAPPMEDQPLSVVTLELLRTGLAAAPPFSSPHRDGWRNEHLVDFARDPTCGSALTRVLTAVLASDVPQKTADILSSATLIVLLKRDAAAMEALELKQGAAYLQPQRPIEWAQRSSKQRVTARS